MMKKTSKALSLLLILTLLLSLFSFTLPAMAYFQKDYSSLIFDPDMTSNTSTTGGVTYKSYQVTYCTEPVQALAAGYF